jgi:U4/U6.U5 tri-snRNP-associated protein 1
MDIDEKPSIRRRNLEEDDLVDDEDFQAVLARQRRSKIKKTKPLDPDEIARKSMCLEHITIQF